METFFRDLRHALRSMRRSFSFTVMVTLCLALGIGANSAIFSIVDAVLLRPLPYADSERLAFLPDVHQGPDEKPTEFPVSPANYVAWKERSRSFDAIEAMMVRDFNMTTEGEPQRIKGAAVSAGFLPMLGVRPIQGRTFQAEDDQPGKDTVVVLSHGLWQSLGGDPKLIGSQLRLDGQSYTVLGVLPAGYHLFEDSDLWVPLAINAGNIPRKGSHFLQVIAHLKPGVSLDSAQQEMDSVARTLEEETPDLNVGWSVKVKTLRDQLVGDVRKGVVVLMAAVGFLLLIACVNVANLLLARSTELSNQLALRSALGADRKQVVQQVLIESVTLAVAGGVLGFLFAMLGVRPLLALSPVGNEVFRNVHIDAKVFGFTLLISVLTGLAFGLIPAFRAARPNLYKLLQSSGRRSTDTGSGRRFQSILVVVEIALALVLLVGAGLMIKSFRHLQQIDPGFSTENLLTLEMAIPRTKYPEDTDRSAFVQRVLDKVSVLPGVTSAAATTSLPVNELSTSTGFVVEGRAPAKPGEILLSHFRRISPNYLQTLGVSLVKGRWFTAQDSKEAPKVVLVSQSMADRYWPNQEAVGRRIQRPTPGPDAPPWLTVVGVVGNVNESPLGTEDETGATFYMPYAQSAPAEVFLVVRTSTPPKSLIGGIRRSVQEVDREQPIQKIATMEERLFDSASKQRFNTFLLTFFAGLGVLLASIGIYGVISYSVNQRVHEFGIRMALGAKPADVLRMVLKRGLTLTAVGLLVGVSGALLLSRSLSGLLYQVQATDPWTFVQIALVLMAVALLACYLPARRATRISPMISLRNQ
jgi:putative ABC transport system permease protein